MPAPDEPHTRRERLRLSTRSVVVAVAMFGGTLAALGVVAAARRVIGWILVAAVAAGLLHPIVTFLARHMPRGLAVLVVMTLLLASASAVVYGLVDDLQRETSRLQQAAPERAQRLEQSPRFGKLARDLKLVERTRKFVRDVPERLRGGTPADALRAAATRGVAFLATGVLTIFFLLHGPRIGRAGLRQIDDPDRRARARSFALSVYTRAFGYASANLTMAVAAGLFAFALARWADVPGPAPLAVWVGLWDLVPVAGAFVGAAPIVVLAAVVSAPKAVVLIIAFVGYQMVEDLAVQRRVEQATIRVGPFLTLVAGLVGIEISGIAAALILVLAVTMVMVAVEELAQT
jgi:predicted PurR-regulated permease PerM